MVNYICNACLGVPEVSKKVRNWCRGPEDRVSQFSGFETVDPAGSVDAPNSDFMIPKEIVTLQSVFSFVLRKRICFGLNAG